MPVTNLNALRRRIKELGKLPTQTVGLIAQAVAIEAFSGCIEATPVDTGELRLGWFASIGTASSAKPPKQPKKGLGLLRSRPGDPVPGDSDIAERMVAIVQTAPDLGRTWFSNNTPPAVVIETGGFEPADPGPSQDDRPGRKDRILVQGGYSTQAPRGMLRNGQIRAAAKIREFSSGQRERVRVRGGG